MKALIICSIACLFINSCVNCGDTSTNLTMNEIGWITYTNGQVLIFKSNIGKVDTGIVATNGVGKTLGNQSYHDPCHYDFQEEDFGITGLDTLNIGLHIEHTNGGNIGNLKSGISAGLKGTFLFANYPSQNNVLVNGKSYNNVFIMFVDTSNWSPLIPDVWRIYYTKAKGILEYDYTQGISWVKIN